jgi:hypothetical protein
VYEDDGAAFRIWRPIIAAVARSAWLDEEERLMRESFTMHPSNGYQLRQDAVKAKNNAEAWKVWGAQ